MRLGIAWAGLLVGLGVGIGCGEASRTPGTLDAGSLPDAPTVDSGPPADTGVAVVVDTGAPDGGPPVCATTPTLQHRCGEACVNLQEDANNCGACGMACRAGTNATPTCRAGRCVQGCQMGFLDCDGDAANGCEVSGVTSTAHCGRCGNACPTAPRGRAVCAMGVCGVACDEGFADCNASSGDGCETETRANVMHCGGCGMACSTRNATPACAMGACQLTCAEGTGDCDGMAANGCEADTRASNTHCGACGRACAAGANATAQCRAGACEVTCAEGFANCDANPANGCEVDLRVDPAHCGMCANRCPPRSNAAPACAARACGITCGAGFGDCDRDAANGCEINLAVSTAHCGACGLECAARPESRASCELGTCRMICNPGRGNCDGNEANGCETDLQASADHCGACGMACRLLNAASSCVMAACRVDACREGYGDCDGMAGTGCEADIRANAAHCGRCGNACPTRANARPSCAAGACGIVCDPGFRDCDGNAANGCEHAGASCPPPA